MLIGPRSFALHDIVNCTADSQTRSRCPHPGHPGRPPWPSDERRAEPGLAPQRDQNGELVLDQDGDPVLIDTSPDQRWIGNGPTILDNKGNPVRQYEPYFSSSRSAA